MDERSNPPAWIEVRPGSVLRVTIPASYSDQEFAQQFDQLQHVLREAQESLRLLIVIKMQSRSTPSNRERAKRFFHTEKLMLKRTITRAALVSDNVAIRGAIAAVRLLGLFPFPTKTFEDAAAAETWLSTGK